MKTKEEILKYMNLPEVFWQYDMQKKVMRAMEEYAQQVIPASIDKQCKTEMTTEEALEAWRKCNVIYIHEKGVDTLKVKPLKFIKA